MNDLVGFPSLNLSVALRFIPGRNQDSPRSLLHWQRRRNPPFSPFIPARHDQFPRLLRLPPRADAPQRVFPRKTSIRVRKRPSSTRPTATSPSTATRSPPTTTPS